MASILDLPTELLEPISSALDPFDKTHLAMTCKRLYYLLENEIYRSLELIYKIDKHNPPYVDPDFDSYHRSPLSVQLLARTILKSPRHAENVESLRLRETGFEEDGYLQVKLSQDYHDRVAGLASALNNTLESLRLPENLPYCYRGLKLQRRDGLMWHQEIEQYQINAILALTISHLKNLTSLSISTSHAGLCYVSSLFRHLICEEDGLTTIPHFPHLRRLELETDIRERSFTYTAGFWQAVSGHETYAPFFYLPALVEFELCLPAMVWLQNFPWPNRCAPDLTQLRLLYLHRTGIEPAGLYGVLREMPCLHELRYDLLIGTTPRTQNDGGKLDCSHLQEALDHLKTCLQKLFLSIQMTCDYDRSIMWKMENYGIEQHLNFSNFDQLKTLEIASILLLGACEPASKTLVLSSRLPVGLRTLDLRDDLAFHSMYPWRSGALLREIEAALLFKNLAGSKSKRQLQLMKLTLSESGYNPNYLSRQSETEDAEHDWDEAQEEEFYRICRDANIPAILERTPANPWFPFTERQAHGDWGEEVNE